MNIKVNDIKIDRYQKKVIKSKSQNLLVLAGAGSGKTFTIIAKIKKLIIDGTLPEEILCISFTKASSKSLEEKLKKENINIKVRTFHSLGYEIINKYKNIKITSENTLKDIIENELKNNKYLKEITNTKFIRVGYPDKIYRKLENNIILNSKHKERLKEIIITFINLYKAQNKKIKDFKTFDEINKKDHMYDQVRRHKYFLNLTKSIIIKYNKTLKKRKEIDYHDMINEATQIVKIKGIYPYKYIIIDEYQDTSLNKTELIKEIQNKTNAKLMAVGDDFQSIYAFTGSNLEIFTDFKNIFPKSKIIKLKNTYRNPKELLKITNKFICKNKNQLKKHLKSNKTNKYPIKIYYYENDIREIWNKVIKEINSKDILILGRNNKDKNKLPSINKNMKYLTMHKSKGLESDRTIIINLENTYDSIPSKIEDSEYLTYVKPKIDEFPYAEERRLFYVALTRCKNSNYLLVNKRNPSIFVKELIKDYPNNIIIKNL